MYRLFNLCLLTTAAMFCLLQPTTGQPTSYKFVQRDTTSLWLDVYQPEESVRKDICVMYVFGGGFFTGSRTGEVNVRFFNNLVDRGYTVVAIDYRLGLVGIEHVSPLNPKPGFEAVRMATEDLIAATSYILDNHEELRIDPRRIVTMGSSAGAITVLQADYELANRRPIAQSLPADFRYAGVVSLAGAIFSTHGRPRYATAPAPTLMYHGTKDKVVVYNKIQIFNLGMFGTKSLVKIFDKNSYPYMAVRYEGIGHEVATFPRFYVPDEICAFIDSTALGKYNNELDITVKDKTIQDEFRKK